jgi:hypothetical protein
MNQMLIQQIAVLHNEVIEGKRKISDLLVSVLQLGDQLLTDEKQWFNRELTGYDGNYTIDVEQQGTFDTYRLLPGYWGIPAERFREQNDEVTRNKRVVCGLGAADIENSIADLFGPNLLESGIDAIVLAAQKSGHAITMEHDLPTSLEYIVPSNSLLLVYGDMRNTILPRVARVVQRLLPAQ